MDVLSRQYNLDGKDHKNSREKHTLVVRTIRHLVLSGTIRTTSSKRGNKPKISCDFLKLVALHVNMEQVGVHSEMLTNQIKATVSMAMFSTPYQRKFNDEYVW